MTHDLIISRTKNIFEKKTNTNFVLIGQWLIENFKKEEIESHKIQINKPASFEQSDRKKSYLICEQIFNAIIRDFCKSLNNLHSIQLSERAWRIIAESWIKRFIYICYNRKETLDLAFDNFNLKNIHLKINNDYNFYTRDSEGQYPASVDDVWNSNLYSKILKYFEYNVNIIEEKNSENFINVKTYSERIRKSKKNLKFKIIKSIFNFNKFFVRENDGVIFNSYLPFVSEKILELYLKQVPQFWQEDEIQYLDFDDNLRNKISIINNKNEKSLENFIRQMMPNSLPNCFVESFKSIFQNAGHKKFPKNPKFIFTSVGFDHDELLKFYVAKNVDKGKKYFVGQHGSSYFTEHDKNFRAEVNSADNFFSWGYFDKEKKNIYPLFNLKTFNKRVKNNAQGKFTIVCRSLGYRAAPWDRYYEGLLGIEKISKLMNIMPKKIEEKTIIRLHQSFKLERSKYFLEKYFNKYNKNLEFGIINYKKLISNSRLVCFNYDSTGFLENLNYNIPSVAIWDNTFNHLNDKFKKKYELLLEANIIFNDEKKLINHLNNYWDNIYGWWNSEVVRTNLNEFQKNFNNSGNFKDFKILREKLKNA